MTCLILGYGGGRHEGHAIHGYDMPYFGYGGGRHEGHAIQGSFFK